MRRRPTLCAALVAFLGALASLGTAAAGQTLSFTLNRTGPPPVHYTVRVDAVSGAGFFQAEGAREANAGTGAAEATPITVGEPTRKKLLAALPAVEAGHCETHSKKIAQTGTKTLRYERDGKSSACTFNFSDDDRVNTAAALFEALGEMMEYGNRLAAKLRFDRLGLDAEMDNLQDALADGRAVEVRNILPVLQAIVNDDRVMDQVRRKVERVLQGAGVSVEPAVPGSSPGSGPASER